MIRPKKIDAVLVAAFLVTLTLSMAISLPKEQKSRREERRAPAAVETTVKAQPAFQIDEKKFQERLRQNPKLARRFALFSIGFFLIAFGSLWCIVVLGMRLWKGQPAIVPLGSPPSPAWNLREILRLILLILVVGQTALLIEWAIFKLFRPPWLDRNVLSLGNTVLMDGLAAVYVWTLLRRISGHAGRAFSLPAVRFGIASYLVFLPFFFMLTSAVYSLMQALHLQPQTQPAVMMFLSETRASVVWWLTILATVGGPVAEELFFRGMLYGYLRKHLGVGVGLALSALLFAVLHANLLAFLPVLALGLLFGWVYEQTGTLMAPIAIHVLHNTGMIALAALLKELMN